MMVAEIKMSFISKVFPLRLRRSNPSTPTREERLESQSLFLFIVLVNHKVRLQKLI